MSGDVDSAVLEVQTLTGTVTSVSEYRASAALGDGCAVQYRYSLDDGATCIPDGQANQRAEAYCTMQVGDPIELVYDPAVSLMTKEMMMTADRAERMCELDRKAWLINAHQNGDHRLRDNGPQADCPLCVAAAADRVVSDVDTETEQS